VGKEQHFAATTVEENHLMSNFVIKICVKSKKNVLFSLNLWNHVFLILDTDSI